MKVPDMKKGDERVCSAEGKARAKEKSEKSPDEFKYSSTASYPKGPTTGPKHTSPSTTPAFFPH